MQRRSVLILLVGAGGLAALAYVYLTAHAPAVSFHNIAAADDERDARLVEAHLREHFPGDAPGAAIWLWPEPSGLPAGAYHYSVHSPHQPNELPYLYIVIEGRVYCSGTGGEFERFLKDYRYFEKLDLGAVGMLNLAGMIGPAQPLAHVSEDIIRMGVYSEYPPMQPPELVQSKDGLTLKFYATNALDLLDPPAPRTLTVTPDYRAVLHTSPPLCKRR